tara:strand:+ start:333 stop:851 length:519 start_codon:yes stop_codon:yes gene_type:complete
MCNQIKPIADFRKTLQAQRGHHSKCKCCERQLSREWYANNLEKARAISNAWIKANPKKQSVSQKAWVKNNPDKVASALKTWRDSNPEAVRNASAKRRALKLNNGTFRVTAKELRRMLAAGCSYCDALAEHIDHIVPISHGGTHSIGNLTGACASCNLSKGAKFITEWKKGKS